MFSELEKLKEESKVLKEIEKYQKETKLNKQENYSALNSTHSNLRNSFNEHDAFFKADKEGYTLINTNSGNFYGNVFCFP